MNHYLKKSLIINSMWLCLIPQIILAINTQYHLVNLFTSIGTLIIYNFIFYKTNISFTINFHNKINQNSLFNLFGMTNAIALFLVIVGYLFNVVLMIKSIVCLSL